MWENYTKATQRRGVAAAPPLPGTNKSLTSRRVSGNVMKEMLSLFCSSQLLNDAFMHFVLQNYGTSWLFFSFGNVILYPSFACTLFIIFLRNYLFIYLFVLSFVNFTVLFIFLLSFLVFIYLFVIFLFISRRNALECPYLCVWCFGATCSFFSIIYWSPLILLFNTSVSRLRLGYNGNI